MCDGESFPLTKAGVWLKVLEGMYYGLSFEEEAAKSLGEIEAEVKKLLGRKVRSLSRFFKLAGVLSDVRSGAG